MHILYPTFSASLASSAAAWQYFSGQGFGITASRGHEALFREAGQHPNATRSVPFQIGNQNWTLRVNVTELDPIGADTNIDNPRVISTLYDLRWPGGASINRTIAAAEGLQDNQGLRLCVSMTLGPFPARQTNRYKISDNGDCTNALGANCVKALKAYGLDVGMSCGANFIPSACKSLHEIGSTSLLDPSPEDAVRYNLTEVHTSPFAFGFYASPIYNAGDQTQFQRETESLKFFWITGTKASSPICIRVKDNKVKQGDPGTSDVRSDLNSASAWFAGAVGFRVLGYNW